MKSKNDTYSTVPVGIDLGTTYSSLAYLTPQGHPVTVVNAEGELSTPSIVLFDGNDPIVGTEALRQSVASPERVVQYAKRHMGDPNKFWLFDGVVYRPKDISAIILKKLINDASEQLGEIRHAVITVPAQFSDLQRRDTVEAGLAAGLERVDIIHEPVAASLCYVLADGMWFAELANEQTVLVFDLGGGTFDISLVKYNKNEVRVIASGGDLMLGGLDWNRAIETFACDEFSQTSSSDPRLDRESMQGIAIEVEQVKRSLSVRPKSTLTIQHDGRRKTIPLERVKFEELTAHLVNRTETITREMLKSHKMGWAHVDTILATGGSSRMPMIRSMLERVGGTTLNQSLSPDQSICHGAAYYAGMLLTQHNRERTHLAQAAVGRLSTFRQNSVSGRSLGILVRDLQHNEYRPQYLLPANTPLPCAFRQRFGTARQNQSRVQLKIVESGANPTDPHLELGECLIEELPPELPIGSPIEVTIRYDEQAIVSVEAVLLANNARVKTTLVRPTLSETPDAEPVPVKPADENLASRQVSISVDQSAKVVKAPLPAAMIPPPLPPLPPSPPSKKLELDPFEDSDKPIPLCNACGEILNSQMVCPACNTPARRIRPKSVFRPPAAGENAIIPERMTKTPGENRGTMP
ncbi:Hsp70 family protein [Planctomicrobium sp. SH668]|uniref:Hsp70 family protein n=1 Tax=Planctomicrobium sp. SH668 TaxID=3448126 RepID=UPI003F5C9953